MNVYGKSRKTQTNMRKNAEVQKHFSAKKKNLVELMRTFEERAGELQC